MIGFGWTSGRVQNSLKFMDRMREKSANAAEFHGWSYESVFYLSRRFVMYLLGEMIAKIHNRMYF